MEKNTNFKKYIIKKSNDKDVKKIKINQLIEIIKLL